MGQVIGKRYHIEKKLGEGGMGTVYQGIDNQANKPVAIKQLKPNLASPELIERFEREGEALRQLKHPNIVQLLDVVAEDEQNYLIMEYVAGGDLSQVIAQAALPVEQVLRLGIDLCDALTRAHKLEIIHRDLKPANILIAEDGTVRLTDFGVAHFGSKAQLTNADSVIGTIDYLAPETFSQAADKRADIWAVGVILYEMLLGQRPFSGETIGETLHAIIAGDMPDIEKLRNDIPVALADLIYRILVRNPDERIPSIRLVGAELEALLQAKPITSSKTKPKIAITSIFIDTPLPEERSKHNLPHQNTAFVGRDAELSSLSKLLNDSKVSLVTIIAQGGMGKTRLSIETARSLLADYPQGVFFVELAPLADADSIPNAIAEAVGFPFASDGRSPSAQIVDYFREKQILLVLDNFEHVLDGRDLVQAILNASPKTKILASSRERLGLSAEHLFQLEGMDFPEWETPKDALNFAAMRLFVESAKRIRADFTLEEADLSSAARICRLVNGLPLAIILAATWLDTLSITEIAEEIAQSMDFLESNFHDLPERQRSLRAVFDYSWHLLKPEEQAAFARLAVFRGGMSRQAAQSISEINLRSLQTFVNKSLLRRDNVSGRYEIHEMLRQYAEEILLESGLFEDTRAKHAHYYAAAIAERENDIKGRRQLAAMSEIDGDFENVKVAWRFACETAHEENISKMLEPIYWYCSFRNRNMEGLELFVQARQVFPVEDNNPSLVSGRLLMRFPIAKDNPLPSYEKALAIASYHDAKREVAFAKRQLGHLHSHSLWNQEVGVPWLLESIQEFEALSDDFHAAVVYDDIGWSYNLMGKKDAQIASVEKSIELRRKLGDKIGMSSALRNLGGAHGGFGSNKPEPLQHWQEALKLSQEIGDKRNITWNTFMVGVYYEFEGEFERSHPYRETAFELAKEIHEEVIIGLSHLCNGVEQVLICNDIAAAKADLATGAPEKKGRDMRVLLVYALRSMIATVENNIHDLKALNAEMFEYGIDFDHPFMIWSVFVASMVAHGEGHTEKAVEYLGILMQPQFAHPKVMKQWDWFAKNTAALERKLGKEAYQAAFARGQAADPSVVIREVKATWKPE